MDSNSLASEQAAVVGILVPVVQGAGTVLTAAIDMSKFRRIQAIIQLGVMVASSTVNAKLVSSATSGGSYTDVTGKAITALTQAGTDDNKQSIINLSSSQLTAGHRFVKLSVTVAVANCALAAIVMGQFARINPASDNDLASVDEIIA